jgi:hypothetical protein
MVVVVEPVEAAFTEVAPYPLVELPELYSEVCPEPSAGKLERSERTSITWSPELEETLSEDDVVLPFAEVDVPNGVLWQTLLNETAAPTMY